MLIRGIELDIDVREEIGRFEWQRARDKGHELVACSPFRDEKHPSFSINLETGLWIDFGSVDDDTKKGNLVTLLAYLEESSEDEIEEHLLAAYGVMIDSVDDLPPLQIQLVKEEPVRPKLSFPEPAESVPYLESRGVSKEIIQLFQIGVNEEKGSVAFPWIEAYGGELINVKFRNIAEKKFYYTKGGGQVKDHLYGLYQAVQQRSDCLYIVESEIDALYLWSCGYHAAALGGSYLSTAQAEQLRRLGPSVLVVATDNDEAGLRCRNQIWRELGGDGRLFYLDLPEGKDVNDLSPKQLHETPRKRFELKFNLA